MGDEILTSDDTQAKAAKGEVKEAAPESVAIGLLRNASIRLAKVNPISGLSMDDAFFRTAFALNSLAETAEKLNSFVMQERMRVESWIKISNAAKAEVVVLSGKLEAARKENAVLKQEMDFLKAKLGGKLEAAKKENEVLKKEAASLKANTVEEKKKVTLPERKK